MSESCECQGHVIWASTYKLSLLVDRGLVRLSKLLSTTWAYVHLHFVNALTAPIDDILYVMKQNYIAALEQPQEDDVSLFQRYSIYIEAAHHPSTPYQLIGFGRHPEYSKTRFALAIFFYTHVHRTSL